LFPSFLKEALTGLRSFVNKRGAKAIPNGRQVY
jgi:hypothetical protein